MAARAAPATPAETKACCVVAYESPWANLLLGDSFHPGGVALTLDLGKLLGLGPGVRVLDAACGRGASAIALAKAYQCSVHGVDLGAANIEAARAAARDQGLDGLVSFECGDAERLPAGDGGYDALICECAFCTFPSKGAAAREFARVLRPGGRLGLSDITRDGELPPDLDSLLGWVACLADALPADGYVTYLAAAGFGGFGIIRRDTAVTSLARDVKLKLLGAEVLARLGKGPFPLEDILEAKRLAKAATESIRRGALGYAVVTGTREGANG